MGLYQKYMALPFKVKIFIWTSTAGVAFLTDSISEKIFEQNMIDVEADRRVELELERLRREK